MRESRFKNKLSAIEVHSVIDKLKDKEPTPAWMRQLKDVLMHYGILMKDLGELAANSNKRNAMGRKYGRSSLANILSHYTCKFNGFTKNGQKTINDHLDILAEYLINPDSSLPEEHPILTLRERLEAACYCQSDVDTTINLVDHYKHRAKVKRIKKHKKHKKHNVYITINIGR